MFVFINFSKMSDSNSSNGSSTNSLVDLRRFRFQKRKPNKIDTSDDEDSNHSSKNNAQFWRKTVNPIDDSDSDSKLSNAPPISENGKEEKEKVENENENASGSYSPPLNKRRKLEIVAKKTPKPEKAKKSKKSKSKSTRHGSDCDSDGSNGKSYSKQLFDSDEDSDTEISNDLTGDKHSVFEFLQNAQISELMQLQACNQKKAEAIVECRPFASWSDLIEKLRGRKFLSTDIVNAVQSLLQLRKSVNDVMKKCTKISQKMEKAVAEGASKITEQSSLMTQDLRLSSYQIIGLNWLSVLHSNNVNGILADEMGLGKTVQVIAFLTYLKEIGLDSDDTGPHIIIVPSSTIENWMNEFERWSPSLNFVQYYGSQMERRDMRMDWRKGGLDDVDVIITTYNLVTSTPEEKVFFRKLKMGYAVFDEAHMLKNMNTKRFEHLFKINSKRRLLLTGTPLQNNLVELMSLLTFIMPEIFRSIKDDLQLLFSKNYANIMRTTLEKTEKTNENGEIAPLFEQQQVMNAKEIMKPFFLRRLKKDVLKDLPQKTDHVMFCPMEKLQKESYDELIAEYSSTAERDQEFNGAGLMMTLRKMANHRLLMRNYYTEDKLKVMASRLAKDPFYKQTNPEYIFEDLLWKSDYQLNQLTRVHKCLSGFGLPQHLVLVSGKFEKLDELLPKLKAENHRVLIFSQFTMILDIMEEYMALRQHKFLRLDGQTPVQDRQTLIDRFNQDPSIFIFLLSTKAGGLGINLTAADTVIIHDIDFNPHNDRQAEDRCHRVGQKRDVTVIRLISADTFEEQMYEMAKEKLSLEYEVTKEGENENTDKKSVMKMLKAALRLDANKPLSISMEENEKHENGLDTLDDIVDDE